MWHDCIVPGCIRQGSCKIKLQVMQPGARASFAIVTPNTGAWLCGIHAVQGMEVDLVIKPTRTEEVATFVSAEDAGEMVQAVSGVTPIPAKAADEVIRYAKDIGQRGRSRDPSG